MTILVDTSVWADFFNGWPSAEADVLQGLLEQKLAVATCGLVVTEVFQGLQRERPRLRSIFSELIWLEPQGRETYFQAADLYRELRGRGVTIRSTVDCLLATLASENGSWILARDRDLEMILASGLVRARAWPTPGRQEP